MIKTHKVVMVLTEGHEGSIFKLNASSQQLHTEPTGKMIPHKSYHLYIISDDEIQEDDWFMGNSMGAKLEEVRLCNSIKNNFYYQDKDEGYGIAKKIIATTDKYLTKEEIKMEGAGGRLIKHHLLPQIPQSFIESYVKNPVEEIELEYEYQIRAINYGTEEKPKIIKGFNDWTTVGMISSVGLAGVERREKIKLVNNEIVPILQKPLIFSLEDNIVSVSVHSKNSETHYSATSEEFVEMCDKLEQKLYTKRETKELCHNLINKATSLVREIGHCVHIQIYNEALNNWLKENLK